jgi:ABC-type transport system involved in multi-copper enzyme maturation permease subunit
VSQISDETLFGRLLFYLDANTLRSLEGDMNHKRGWIALIVGFLFVFFFGFLWHGILMKPAYMEIASHWRPDDDFQHHFPILILGHCVIAFAFTGLYISKVGIQSAGTGIGYGIVIGILCTGANLIRFATEPLTTKILLMWVAGDLIMFAILGALVGAIYKPLADR